MQIVINIDDNFYKRAMVYKGEQYVQIEGLRMYKRLINGLPDGYPMPINK